MNSFALAQLKENWGWYFGLGICLVLFGFLATIFASVTTLFSVIYLGALLIMAGVTECIKSGKINKWSYFFGHLLLGVLYTIAGFFILFNPAVNAVTLTVFLAAFFVVSGITRIYFALAYPVPHKGWLLINGLFTILLGILIWAQWPISGLWVIGTLVGIEIMITGFTWIALALKAKNS